MLGDFLGSQKVKNFCFFIIKYYYVNTHRICIIYSNFSCRDSYRHNLERSQLIEICHKRFTFGFTESMTLTVYCMTVDYQTCYFYS